MTEKQLVALQMGLNSKVQKDMERFEQTLSKLVDKLADDGWTLPAELGIYSVNVLGQTDDIHDINAFLNELFTRNDYKVTKKMIGSILNSKIREGLKTLVRQCWRAFEEKSYAICATSLLSVIEGVLSEFGTDKRDVRMMKICQEHVDTFPENGSVILKYTWISYNKFIRNLYKKSNFEEDEPEEINRHWLLHGRSDFEISELDCLRLFNAIESLCMILKKESSDNDG